MKNLKQDSLNRDYVESIISKEYGDVDCTYTVNNESSYYTVIVNDEDLFCVVTPEQQDGIYTSFVEYTQNDLIYDLPRYLREKFLEYFDMDAYIEDSWNNSGELEFLDSMNLEDGFKYIKVDYIDDIPL